MRIQNSNVTHSIGFEPEEVRELIVNLIDRKINAYKIEFMQHWEANHNFNAEIISQKIRQLNEKKEELNKHFYEVQQKNQPIDILRVSQILI
ncbi:hypothetical protein [Pleomorphovibrio marinus]|uniref:hypothetical protein n=1 Tax=Pleomorphovibrio marinus TaxID=2164132 RepID=UPI000E0B8747|nr:hypothetical protein [Pleomorphovibrio marinus]